MFSSNAPLNRVCSFVFVACLLLVLLVARLLGLLFVRLFVRLHGWLFVRSFVRSFVRLFVHLFVCLWLSVLSGCVLGRVWFCSFFFVLFTFSSFPRVFGYLFTSPRFRRACQQMRVYRLRLILYYLYVYFSMPQAK